MTITAVPAAAAGLPPSILAFPSERARPSAQVPSALDRGEWLSWLMADHVASQFRGMTPTDSVDTVAKLIGEFGAACVAKILEDNRVALSALRGIVANLAEADRRIAAAADHVLKQEGA